MEHFQLQPSELIHDSLHVLRTHVLIVVPVLVLLHFLRRRYASPLRHIPGPYLASLSRIWKVWSVATTHTELDFIAIHKKYGPVVRIAPNEISFSKPTAAREVLSAGKGFHKNEFYTVFPPKENPDIFTEIRESVHAQKKRVAAAPYSLNAMQQLTPYIDDTITLLLSKLDEFATVGVTQVDLGEWLHFFAFDVLGEIAFSKKFGFLETGTDVENAIAVINQLQRYNGIVGQIPFMDKYLRNNPLRRFMPFMDNSEPLLSRLAWQELRLRQRSESKVERTDLLGQLLRGHEANLEKFGVGDVFAVAHGAILAGADSTASTMQSFLHHILKDRSIYHRVIAEIEEANSLGQLSTVVQWAEAQRLPYFQAALKEAWRMRPPVGLPMGRVIPPGGAVIDGVRYPPGTGVNLNAWVIHRDQETFGADADIYRPERWLEGEEQKKLMDRHMFQFGGGSHLCIGKNLALLELNKVLPMVLRRYRFELVHPERELEYQSFFFVVQQGLDVHISKAQQVPLT